MDGAENVSNEQAKKGFCVHNRFGDRRSSDFEELEKIDVE